jgi:NTP pyrophosphatase (non-canonical NTP hydrolase)
MTTISSKLPSLAPSIVSSVGFLQQLCHDVSRESGWWPEGATANPLVFSTKLCLVHSEVSESMEGDRKDLMDDHLPHRKMREVELADAMIRILDIAGAYGMDLGGAIAEKLAYNTRRADHKPENREQAGGKAY